MPVGSAGWYADERNARLRRGKGQQFNKDWVRTLLNSGGRASEEGETTPPRGYATGNTLPGFRLSSITSIQNARIWERVEIIRARVGENNSFY